MASTSANTSGYKTQDWLIHASQGDANRPSTSVSSQSLNPRNAFEGLAPSTSTSSRSTIAVKKVPYDVFINHRGPDVKKGFATDIYNTLSGIGLRVFLDSQELELGDSFPHEVEEAMSSASLHLAIFSENYARSPWCLAELSVMLKTGTKIVPIFYHVEPEVVRHAKGVYAEAFSRHEENGRHPPEKLAEWKKALSNVSFNVGHIITIEDDETKLLKDIANHAVKITKNVPFVVAKHPVGLDEIIKDFQVSVLESAAQSHSTAQIVGIWDMGGLGKTTLAKKLYNDKFKTMERCSFLFDVRDAAHKSILHIKQKKLLEDLGFKDEEVEKVENVEEGKGILARYLRSVRVLIVLDDVDHVDQLDALVPEKDNLRPGSLIVVTTRQLDVLTGWNISSSSVYKMKGLNPSHCKQLFCWNAFLQPLPKDGFGELANKFIDVCHGLPLSLKVFGGQLYGKSEQYYWENQLEKITRVLPGDIMKSLKLSYDALDSEEKEAFLDAACFFIGEHKSLAVEVWNGSEGNGLYSFETLVRRCFVEVDEMDCIRMHDHLRDLGREISRQLSSHRLWFPHQVEVRRKIQDPRSNFCSCFPLHRNVKVEKQIEKKISIRGILATSTRMEWVRRHGDYMPYQTMLEPDKSSHEGRKVVFYTNEGIWTLSPSLGGLKYIVVEGHDLHQVIGEALQELVWLRLFHAGRRNLPWQLSLKKLMVLEICEEYGRDNHFKELWNDASDAPIQLRVLVIIGCIEFQRFPESIGSLKHLKKLVVDSWYLKSLPSGFCLLQSLEHLELMCDNLSSLPDNFGDLRNMRYLCLQCRHLKKLPVSFKRLTLLQYLELMCFFKRTFESDITEDMTKLEYVDLYGCTNLEELPLQITNQRSLIQLRLHTESLREVPVSIGQLSKLQNLSIFSNLLTSLPTSLGDMSLLTTLTIDYCEKLESLPDSLGQLSMLENLSIKSSGVKSLWVGELINLQELLIHDCPISELDLVSGLLDSSLCNLKKIELMSTELSKISISEDCCPNLESLTLRNNSNLVEIQELSKTLERITLVGSPKLQVLPGFEQFSSLQVFKIYGCYGVRKIHGLEHCKALDKRWISDQQISC